MAKLDSYSFICLFILKFTFLGLILKKKNPTHSLLVHDIPLNLVGIGSHLVRTPRLCKLDFFGVVETKPAVVRRREYNGFVVASVLCVNPAIVRILVFPAIALCTFAHLCCSIGVCRECRSQEEGWRDNLVGLSSLRCVYVLRELAGAVAGK